MAYNLSLTRFIATQFNKKCMKQFKHSFVMSFIIYAILIHMPQCIVSKEYDKQLSNGYKRNIFGQ